MRIASVLSCLLGLGFGIPCAYGIWYLARQGSVWMLVGYPTYGDGPFAQRGIATTVPLMVGFLVVCVAEVVVGWLLWTEPTVGAWMSIAILPVELLFWIGFALPFGVVLGIVRTVIVLVALSPLVDRAGA
jgi:hypothetical protein